MQGEKLCDNGSFKQPRTEGGDSGSHSGIWRDIQAETAAYGKG